MKLVEVKGQVQVQATSSELDLVGIKKLEVTKMNLLLRIPVSGRVLSSSSVAFQVYEQDLRYIKSGLNFKGADSIYSENEISGVITSVDSIVDPTSRTLRVVGAILKGPRKLIPEAGFRGEIEIELKDRLAIPESSILHTGQGDIIYLIDNKNNLKP